MTFLPKYGEHLLLGFVVELIPLTLVGGVGLIDKTIAYGPLLMVALSQTSHFKGNLNALSVQSAAGQ